MAVFAYLLGSVFGLAAAVFGLAFLGITATTAFSIYFCTALGLGTLMIVPATLRAPCEVRQIYG